MDASWRSWTLGELCAMRYGQLPRREDIVEQGHPIFSGYRVVGYHRRYLYEQPQIVVIARGAGGCGDVTLSPPHAFITNLAIVLQVVSPQVDQRFLYYRLAHTTLRALRGGAAQPQIVLADLRRYRVALPPLEDQRAIGAALGAYDALIANNRRRMALLEQLARTIYHEWFVARRFPGHAQAGPAETAPGQLPEGWELRPFAALADFVNGFAFGPRHWGAAGRPIVKIAELKRGVDEQTPRCDPRAVPPRYHVRSGDVLFSWSADLDVYMWSQGDALLNQHIFNVRPRAGFSRLFLFCALKEHMPAFRSRSQGTTMRHITRAALEQVALAVAPARLRAAFDAQAEPLGRALLTLAAQNDTLRATRDLLMDRLFDGNAAVVL